MSFKYHSFHFWSILVLTFLVLSIAFSQSAFPPGGTSGGTTAVTTGTTGSPTTGTIGGSTAGSTAGPTTGGTTGGGNSWWGGTVINIGLNWHAEVFYDGEDKYSGWEVDNAGEEVPYTLQRDWQTGIWSKNGLAWPAGLEPPMGAFGHAINNTFSSRGVSATSQGEIKIKAKWTGLPQPAPPFLDLKMVSAVNFGHTTPGSGTGQDGIGESNPTFEDAGGGIYGSVSSKKIRRFNVNSDGMVEFTYSPSASSNADGFYSNCGAAAVWVNMLVINRGVSLDSSTHPGSYRKKLTGQTAFWTITDWSTSESHSVASFPFEYATATAEVNPVLYTATGSIKEAKIGLPMYEWGIEPNPPFPFYSHVITQGTIFGVDEGRYTYSGRSPNPSEHLPTLGVGGWYWNVASLEFDKFNPYSRYNSGFDFKAGHYREKFNSVEAAQDTGTTDTINFEFKWDSDGATANAKLKFDWVLPRVKGDLIAEHLERKEPLYPPFTFAGQTRHGGWSELPFDTPTGWASPMADTKDAWWNSVIVDWESDTGPFAKEQVQASLGGIGELTPLKWAAGLAAFADVYAKFSAGPEEIGVSRKADLFLKAYHLQDIYPLPISLPNTNTMTQYHWKSKRRLLYKFKVYADDIYNSSGYVMQKLGISHDIGDYDERQMFNIPGQGGGG